MAALELKQQLRLSQQLIMTPQLQQAIKLLQLSRLELLETISQELETNPLLEEVQEEVGEGGEAGEAGEAGESESAAANGEVPAQDSFQEVEVVEKVREDFDWESYLDEYSSGSPVVVETDPNKEWPSFDSKLSLPASLEDHLAWQLRMSHMTDFEKEIGVHIIGNLNRDGYLDATIEEIAEATRAQPEDVISVLERIQVFDPIGVGARHLQECLIVQARNLNPPNELVVEILERHLEYLQTKNYKALVRAVKREESEVKEAVETILKLDPRPGRAFSDESVEYVSPDLYVIKVDGEYVILLNEDGMPKLRVSTYYKEALSGDQVIPTDAKDYIHGKLKAAAWLIKSIHQRQRTLYRVAQSIVKLQQDFFDHGVAHLKPMVLRDVAEDVGMHESTISRVTANKYMHSTHGIFELKYFFNSSINSVLGDAVASESVKERIRQLIKEENPSKPFSDQDIVGILERENISIARRTVAKYREVLGILPSSKRRKASWG